MNHHTPFAPLARLGYRLQQRDFFAPLRAQLHLQQKRVFYTPDDKRLTCLVSMMSGGHAVCQIDTRLRPDTAWAPAWGLENFAQQSTVAEPLDRFTAITVEQWREASRRLYWREGQAIRHNDERDGLLILDIDFTGLPASKPAEGRTTGYLSSKKGGTDGNEHVSVLPSIMRPDSADCLLASKHPSTACAQPLQSWSSYWPWWIVTNAGNYGYD
jgi:hypothetical protein